LDLIERGINTVHKTLAEKNKKLLYLVISGSHAWGLQRPDSDVDLCGVYQEPTKNILSISSTEETINFKKGDIDIQMWEIGKFFRMLCKHNGNMVALLNYPTVQYADNSIVNWSALGNLFLTKKLKDYYIGYANSQKRRTSINRGGKSFIYTYRELFSGLYLLKYGHMCFNLNELIQAVKENNWYHGTMFYEFLKNIGKYADFDILNKLQDEFKELTNRVEEAAEKSLLLDTYNGYNVCNEMLYTLRIKNLEENN